MKEIDLEASPTGSPTKSHFFSNRWFARSEAKESNPTALYDRLVTRAAKLDRNSRGIMACIPHPNASHKRTLIMFSIELLVTFILFSLPGGSLLLFPFHIVGVLSHEMGHAIMVWLTGGHVLSICIGPNIDGSTKFFGGKFCIISPAGYIGASIFGGCMLFCSFSQRASIFTAYILVGCFGIAAIYAADLFSLVVPIGMIVLFVMLTQFVEQTRDKYLRWIISMMGITSSLFSICDIVEDLVFRNEPKSDAYQFATHCIYSPAIIVGASWCIIAVITIIMFILLGMMTFTRFSSVY